MVSHSDAHFPGLNRAPLHRTSFPALDQSHQSVPSLVLDAYIQGLSPTLSLSRYYQLPLRVALSVPGDAFVP